MRVHDLESFACGESTYQEIDPSRRSDQTSVFVNIVLPGSQEIATYAKLDPATPCVVLDSEFNEQLGLRVTQEKIKLRTLAGEMIGSLERHPIKLEAEKGQALEINTTLFVCESWNRGNFLGYSGFLQRILFALDPEKFKFFLAATSNHFRYLHMQLRV